MVNLYNANVHTSFSTIKRKSKYTDSSVKYAAVSINGIIAGLIFMTGCVAPFSDMQSAKLAGKGKTEVTPIFSSVHFVDDGERTHLQNEYGLQGAYGVGARVDLRVRYEFIDVVYDDIDISAHAIGFGPKIELSRDVHALYLPIGFAFGEDIDFSETWQFHPTFLFTFLVGAYVEFNPSIKVLVPLTGDADLLVACNLGAGISGDLEKWAMRPEIGFQVDPGGDGYCMHFSIGLTVYP